MANKGKLEITTEELLKLCRENGVNSASARFIAGITGFAPRQIENLIMHRKIKEKLQQEGIEMVKQSVDDCNEHSPDCKVTEHKGYQEHSLGLPDKEEFKEMTDNIGLEAIEKSKGVVIDFSKLDEAHSFEISKLKGAWPEDYLDALAYANEMRDKVKAEVKSRLKPIELKSRSIEGLRYEVLSDSIMMSFHQSEAKMLIKHLEIDELIKDLQEVQKIVGE